MTNFNENKYRGKEFNKRKKEKGKSNEGSASPNMIALAATLGALVVGWVLLAEIHKSDKEAVEKYNSLSDVKKIEFNCTDNNWEESTQKGCVHITTKNLNK